MKSRYIQFLVFVLSFAVCAFAQTTKYNYQFKGAFPDTGFKGPSGAHGVAVDPEGKVWLTLFTSTTKDSIAVGGGINKVVHGVYVFNPNGTAAAFSPIKMVTVGAVTDTFLTGSNRGIAKDKKGNIVLTRATGAHYRVNYKTGVGMNRVIPQATSPVMPAFDDLNEMFTANVVNSAGPIRIFDENFSFLGNVIDTSRGFSRTIGVSADGNDVYWTSYTQPGVIRYHSDNGSLGPYNVLDTIMFGMTVESITWHPVTKYLWVSTGNGFAPSAYDSLYTKKKWGNFMFYGFKPPITKMSTPVDSFQWSSTLSPDSLFKVDPRPRGLAFSPTGDTVYVAQFNASGVEGFQRFIGKAVTSVKQVDGMVASKFELSQNYPNPFNPSTQINFSVQSRSDLSLKVFDVLGKEVAQVANGTFEAGVYNVNFDASNLSAGIYFYTLKTSNGFSQTKKMLLIK
ncbi:MAG: T9SS type A sorting domain-containing protein [Bacteroidota bacterium]|nr:T9SS type A sorting domain-containing protein [Bacteroidota bacterium]